MFNIGDFKRYLAEGVGDESPIKGLRPARVNFQEDSSPAIAKTFLKKTLAEHDKVYHPNGYKEGDECNFRAAMKKNDIVDDILAEKPKEDVDVGLVQFKEDEKGDRKVVGIVRLDEAEESLEEEEKGKKKLLDKYMSEVGKDK